VQGPKGKLSVPLPHGITFEQKDGVLTAIRATEDHRALHGLARALVANAVYGLKLFSPIAASYLLNAFLRDSLEWSRSYKFSAYSIIFSPSASFTYAFFQSRR